MLIIFSISENGEKLPKAQSDTYFLFVVANTPQSKDIQFNITQHKEKQQLLKYFYD